MLPSKRITCSSLLISSIRIPNYPEGDRRKRENEEGGEKGEKERKEKEKKERSEEEENGGE